MQTDIDIVVLWVDGNDPAWLKEKSLYSGPVDDALNGSKRYRDWGLMKYWFRAVEKFAPWVHNVFFITWGHLPDFLDPTAEKLKIVNHRDYIPAEYLPTYNSNVIEMNLHRIPELSEHFILFNDDCFFLRPMSSNKFFRNGLPCAYYVEAPFSSGRVIEAYRHTILNDVEMLNRHFSKPRAMLENWTKYFSPKIGIKDRIRTLLMFLLSPSVFSDFKYSHGPNAYLKSTFEAIWRAEPEIMDTDSRSRFRSGDDLTQRLAHYWQFAAGTFSPQTIDNKYFSINNKSFAKICQCICRQSHDTLCINDVYDDAFSDERASAICSVFEQILPEKSHFEK